VGATETLWLVVLGCAAATFVWRGLGVVVVRRIDPDGAFFKWVTCVSYAMVAGLIFRMLAMPESDLAQVDLMLRLGAVAIAFTAYYLSGRRLVAGVLAGATSLAAMAQWLA
jgi:branched-subunit amino acid transport protein